MNIHTYLATASVDLAGLADYLDRLEAAAGPRRTRRGTSAPPHTSQTPGTFGGLLTR